MSILADVCDNFFQWPKLRSFSEVYSNCYKSSSGYLFPDIPEWRVNFICKIFFSDYHVFSQFIYLLLHLNVFIFLHDKCDQIKSLFYNNNNLVFENIVFINECCSEIMLQIFLFCEDSLLIFIYFSFVKNYPCQFLIIVSFDRNYPC